MKFRSQHVAIGLYLALLAAVSLGSVQAACAGNLNTKSAPTFVDAEGQHLYNLDQFVKVVNDISTGAITARKVGALDQTVEVLILSVNKSILVYVRANATNTQATKIIDIISTGQQKLPPMLQGQFTQYMQKALDFLHPVKP